jgi:methylase of polypeptide subunit release factors
MTLSFIEHLAAACRKPINEPVFLEGYQEVLKGVAADGTFVVHGLTLTAPPGVYSPHETSSTRFVMDHFFGAGLTQPGGRFLEIGCGAGGIVLMAARHGWDVHACDIDPLAVAAATANAQRNGLALTAKQSDLFAAYSGELFDVILFNQPFFHLAREINVEERTLSDFGGQLHARFMAEAKQHLAPGGRVILSYSNCSNTDVFNQPGWDLDLRAFDFDAGSDYIRALFAATPNA